MAQAGIKRLLEAEQEAKKTVKEAVEGRKELLKERIRAAEAEGDAYRSTRQRQFDEVQHQDLSSKDQYVKTLAKDSDEQIRKLQAAFAAKREEVIQMLLTAVKEVNNVELKKEF